MKLTEFIKLTALVARRDELIAADDDCFDCFDVRPVKNCYDIDEHSETDFGREVRCCDVC